MSRQSRARRLRSKLHIHRWRIGDLMGAVRLLLCSLLLACGFLVLSGLLASRTGLMEIWRGGELAYWGIGLTGIFLVFRPVFQALAQDFRTLAAELRRGCRVARRWQRIHRPTAT